MKFILINFMFLSTVDQLQVNLAFWLHFAEVINVSKLLVESFNMATRTTKSLKKYFVGNTLLEKHCSYIPGTTLH